jgi:hypothetical protein
MTSRPFFDNLTKNICNKVHFKKGKGKEARLSFMGHIMMENRNGLAVDIPGNKRVTLGADKGYDTVILSLLCAS